MQRQSEVPGTHLAAEDHGRSGGGLVPMIKVVGCMAVVWGHSDSRLIDASLAAVVGFFAISIVGTWNRRPWNLLLRAARTMSLFAAWSCIYLSFFLVLDLLADRPLLSRQQSELRAILLPSLHLWYLPALAVLLGAMSCLGQYQRRRPSTTAMGIVCLAAAVACIQDGTHGYVATAAMSLAFVFVWLMVLPEAVGAVSASVLAAGAVAVVVLEVWSGLDLRVISAISVSLVVVSAFRSRMALGPLWITAIARWSAGIYFVHMIPLWVFRHFGWSGWQLCIVVLCASAAIVAGGVRTPAAWLFGATRRTVVHGSTSGVPVRHGELRGLGRPSGPSADVH